MLTNEVTLLKDVIDTHYNYENPEVKEQFDELLKAIDNELFQVGYEAGDDVTVASENMQKLMDELESELPAAEPEDDEVEDDEDEEWEEDEEDEEEDDEFDGLGEDEDDDQA